MSAGASRKAVLAALAANLGIAVAKFVAFLITRSGSMLAESVHSVADSGNQGLLLVGDRRARRRAGPTHPFGYARESYFYAFMVAIVLFTAGAGFAAREGAAKLRHPEEVGSPGVAIVVLVVAIVLETLSFRTAVRAASGVRGDRDWWVFVRQNKTAELTVVLLEDAAALVGLVLALAGVGLTAATGDPAWDAYGTLSIAALLAVVAVILAIETKSLLIGEAASPEEQNAIHAALVSTPGIESVIHLRTEHRGPEELLVAIKIAVTPGLSADRLAVVIDEAERRIRIEVPGARYVFVEPDVARAGP
jgi:cation diffusion facilitator family transporter